MGINNNISQQPQTSSYYGQQQQQQQYQPFGASSVMGYGTGGGTYGAGGGLIGGGGIYGGYGGGGYGGHYSPYGMGMGTGGELGMQMQMIQNELQCQYAAMIQLRDSSAYALGQLREAISNLPTVDKMMDRGKSVVGTYFNICRKWLKEKIEELMEHANIDGSDQNGLANSRRAVRFWSAVTFYSIIIRYLLVKILSPLVRKKSV